VSQVDLVASLAALTGQKLRESDAPDSLDQSAALLGSATGRTYVVAHSGRLALREGDWEYIAPAPQGVALQKNTNTETANLPLPQPAILATDPGETMNLAPEGTRAHRRNGETLAALQKTAKTRS